MTYRALELLNLPPDQPALLLDIGCGSGLSGEILDEEGHQWVGVDISPSMLGECTFLLGKHAISLACARGRAGKGSGRRLVSARYWPRLRISSGQL